MELLELVEDGQDPELTAEIERDAQALADSYDRERTALLFSGEYDNHSALVTISAGAGGTEATDWAQMLLRMYLRWAERHRFGTEIVDQLEGEQAGLKSVTFAVEGRNAYGYLRAERGVHRLVRISPFDAQKRRQTTFALVEVLPEVEEDVAIELNWDEIRVDTFRSQGAGGQHVNKTDSAVRLTHVPTGIVAQSQNERSQTQNKETAIKVLKARLLERALEEKEAELRQLRGELEVSVVGNDPARIELYGPGEILAGHEFYDYEAKYTPGLSETSPRAEVPDRTRAVIHKIARDAYRGIGAEGFARVDFLLRGDEVYLRAD